MKSPPFNLVLFLFQLVLVLFATANELPPDSIPVQCAIICGPMVELTSKCSSNSKSSFKRSRPAKNGHDQYQYKRSFVVIVPAPTSFAQLSSQPTLDLQPSSTVTRIRPQVPSAPSRVTSTAPASSFSSATPSSTSSTSPSSFPISSTSPSSPYTSDSPSTSQQQASSSFNSQRTGSSGGNSSASQSVGWTAANNTEEDCVCFNDSFDVAEVAALCYSCIAMAPEIKNNMAMVMSICQFAPLTYTTSKDDVVNNIQVKVTPLNSTSGPGARSLAKNTGLSLGVLLASLCLLVVVRV